MSANSDQRSKDFLKISSQFQLGALTTESSHPVSGNLSDVAKADVAAALKVLFDVDDDVLRTYREFARSKRPRQMAEAVLQAVRGGGRLFFTGCGSTGRLSIQLVSIWRDFWQRQAAAGFAGAAELEQRAFSVMAGGDFALIKSVEGFEDFTAFGKKQMGDLGVRAGDVVFAITEGGETSFVIGTAWKGLEVGAKVYFVYNNPDDVLCRVVERSREVIQDERIEKVNLTTGPMAITGSTRMQATTIQLCVVLTVLEMAVRRIAAKERNERDGGMRGKDSKASQGEGTGTLGRSDAGSPALASEDVPHEFLKQLEAAQAELKSPELLGALAKLVIMEEGVYRAGRKNNYFADRFGIDLLTDTTERSPTYCTPAFRKFDDKSATESWAFLFVPRGETPAAWEHIIKRRPRCVEWSEAEVKALVGEEKAARTNEIVKKISYPELMRFKVGLDGLPNRVLGAGDSAVALVSEQDKAGLLETGGFQRSQLEAARASGTRRGLIFVGGAETAEEVKAFAAGWDPECVVVTARIPQGTFLLDGVTRAAVKMLLNALSTCTMVRLGRVMGNYMIWVVPSNLKLIDRSTRYIQRLTGLDYEAANRLLFEVIEYVEPRMRADQAYPPVVGVAVLRAKRGLTNEEAEIALKQEG